MFHHPLDMDGDVRHTERGLQVAFQGQGEVKMRVFKYEVPIKDQFDLQLPVSARVLDVQVQQGTP